LCPIDSYKSIVMGVYILTKNDGKKVVCRNLAVLSRESGVKAVTLRKSRRVSVLGGRLWKYLTVEGELIEECHESNEKG
jgi:hypothetical protein